MTQFTSLARLIGLLTCSCLLLSATTTPAYSSDDKFVGRSPLKTQNPKLKTNENCPRPELLQADLVTDSTARLTWSDVGTKYEIELAVGTDAFTGIPDFVVNADPPFDVTGLTPGRNYRFQVRTVCDDTTFSVWSAPRSFITDLNNARPCPLNLDLRDTSCNNVQIFKLHVDTAPGSALGTDVLLHSVRLMVEHPWRSDLSIWLRSPDSTRIQLIGGLNPGDKNLGDTLGAVCAQFVELTDNATLAQPLSAAAERDNITGYFLPVETLTTLHTGQNPVGVWQVEFCDNKTGDRGKLRLCELVFAPAGCPPVSPVTAGNVTENSAEISWPADALGDSIAIEYGPAGFLPGSAGTAGAGGMMVKLPQPVAVPVQISGLLTLREYDVYVRRQCAPGVWGPNTHTRFFTNCTPTLLETFEGLPSCPTGCPDPCPLPNLWQNAPGDDYEWKVFSGPGLAFPVAGPPAAPAGSGNYLYFRNACSPTGAFGKTAILRTLCLNVAATPAQTCHFSFDLYMNTTSGQMSTLSLQASTDGGQSWADVQIWSGNMGKAWQRKYVNLGIWDGQVTLFQFVATGTFGAYGDMAIDNLAFYGSQEVGTPDYVFYRDADNDGAGDPDVRVISCFPTAPSGYVGVDGDCDDGDPAVYLGAPEVLCNQKDENCNGMADDSTIPAPIALMNGEICFGNPVALTAIGLPKGNFYWYDQATGGAPIRSGSMLMLIGVDTTQTFYLADSLTGPLAGCISARVPATITVRPNPVLLPIASPSICSGKTIDLAALQVVDSANTGGMLTYHSATPATPANQLPVSMVQPASTTTFYFLSTTAFGCSDTEPVTVTVRTSPVVQIAQGDSVSVCRGRTLQLQAMETGIGAPPISYAWSTGLNFPNIPVQSGNTPNVTNTYTVMVTDANGCTGTDQIKVHTLNNVTQTAISSVQNVSICGGNDGSIALSPLNGTPPYTFAWAGGSLSGIIGTGTIAGLGQGSYRITVTDATNAGCSMVMPQIVLNAPGLDVALDTIIHPSCPGALTGSIVLNVNGLNPVINWSNQQIGATATFLGAGTYSATITDGNCTQELSNIEVVAPPPIEIEQNDLDHVRCFGQSNGAIDLAVFGATPPYDFLWSNNATTEDLTGLPAGEYSCTITDANGCTFTSASFSISEPQLLTLQLDSLKNVRCFGEINGLLRAKASGGMQPYQYLWNTGATTATLTAIPAGIYTVTVTDANGCTAERTGVVSQPSSLQVETAITANPTCMGALNGSIELSPAGGQPPYFFNWSAGGSTAKIQNLGIGQYRATITDAQGCSLITPFYTLSAPQLLTVTLDSLRNVGCRGDQTGLIAVGIGGAVGAVSATWNGLPDDLVLTNIAAGQYILKAMDSRLCTISDTFAVAEPASSLTILLQEVRDALCAGEPTGSVSVRVVGGTTPFQYLWSNGSTGLNLPAVPAGSYDLTVTDANGCTRVLSDVVVDEPPALQAEASVEHIPCFGVLTGSIQLAVSGGIPAYRYFWSTSDTTKNVFNLTAGTYSVTVLDATGCAQVLTNLTVIDQASNFSLSPLSILPVSCHAAADGQVAVQVNNGTAPYQFSWSAPVGLHQNIPVPRDTAYGLSGGDFRVTVTDAAGCTAVSDWYNIEEAPPLQLNINGITNIVCKGDSTGAISAQVSGGVPPYGFLWSNGSTQAGLQNLPAGTYQLTVADVRGCTVVSANATVHEPAEAIAFVLNNLQPDKCGKNQGAIALTVTGGMPPHTYLWNHGAQTASLSNLPPGMYQLTVTDNLGCVRVSPEYEIIQLAPPLMASAVVVDVACKGDSTGAVAPTLTGGTPAYQYTWSNGASGTSLTNVPAGTYTLTVSDAAGCFDFWTYPVGQPATALSATWSSDSTASGWTVTLAPQGGTPGYDISWDAATGSQTGPIATGLATGVYAVTVSDANDCVLVLHIPVGSVSRTESPDVFAGMMLAPNPTTGPARLSIHLEAPLAAHIRLFSGLGQLVSDVRLPEKSTRHEALLDLSGLPSGIYRVLVLLENGQYRTVALMKTRG
ncbi:MAG: fibronectin type III domain-containing protein [Saprospiraceae bacterium]|jgi:subtilisin-like proprotein convertase family protein|nr:fibronectin type III domain-containing protein [Saprospiraceae bacterium]